MKKAPAAPRATKTAKSITSPVVAKPRRTPGKTKHVPARPSVLAPSLDDVARRAYEIYLSRNGTPGDPMADWLQAEQELMPAN
jgi:hypothetical protein